MVSCSALVNDPTGAVETVGTGTPPVMTGGKITDGTYVLTSRVDYSGFPCNCTTHIKLKINGSAIQAITRIDSMADTNRAGAVSVSGNVMTWNFNCPSTATVAQQFTATATTLQTLDSQLHLQTFNLVGAAGGGAGGGDRKSVV